MHHSDSISSNAAVVCHRSEELRTHRTVFTANVKTAFLNGNMKDGDVACATHPPAWSPAILESNVGTVVRKLEKSLYGLPSAPKRWQENLENILTKAGFV